MQARFLRHFLRHLPTLLAGAALCGCAVGPNYHAPAAPQTDRYTAQPCPTDDAGNVHVVAGEDPVPDWWQGFGSDAIDSLVQQALRANPNMQAAEATLRQSLENVAAQRGYYLPTIQAQGSATRNRDATQVLSPTLTSGAATYSLYTPQLTVGFVPDLFGGNRRQVESLQAQADANRYQYDAAYLTLIANVVSAAIQQAGLRAQIDATQQVICLERESLDVMHGQLDLGAIAEADVLAQQAALAQIEATLPPLQKGLDQQHDALAGLTGQLPGDAADIPLELDQLKLPAEIPMGIPVATGRASARRACRGGTAARRHSQRSVWPSPTCCPRSRSAGHLATSRRRATDLCGLERILDTRRFAEPDLVRRAGRSITASAQRELASTSPGRNTVRPC